MTIKGRLVDYTRAINVAELAWVLDVSERHIYKLVQSGEIPHFRVGSSVRFDPQIVDRWLQSMMAKHPGYLDDAGKE